MNIQPIDIESNVFDITEEENYVALESLRRLAKDDEKIAAAVLRDFGKSYDKITGEEVRNTLDDNAFRSLVDNNDMIYRSTGVNKKRTMRRGNGKP